MDRGEGKGPLKGGRRVEGRLKICLSSKSGLVAKIIKKMKKSFPVDFLGVCHLGAFHFQFEFIVSKNVSHVDFFSGLGVSFVLL